MHFRTNFEAVLYNNYLMILVFNFPFSNQSFFLGVGFHKPHIPFHIPHQYLDLHDLDKFAEPVNHNRTSDLPDIAWNPWMDLRRRDDIKATFLVTDYRVCRLILVLGS